MEKLLTIHQLSELIQIKPRTIYDWVHIGFIPHYRFPKGVRFREKDVFEWLERRKRKGRKSYKIQIDNISQ